MYLASTNWVSPFHSREWISQIWRLPDSWKHGSNWHRYAIEQNYPELLNFQEENGSAKGRMLTRSPLLYWAPLRKRIAYQSYNLSESWFRSDRIANLLLDNADQVSDVIEKRTIQSIIAAHKAGTDRSRTLAFLLMIVVWKMEVEKAVATPS